MNKVILFDEKYAPFKILNLEGDKKSGFIKKYNLSKKTKLIFQVLLIELMKKIIK